MGENAINLRIDGMTGEGCAAAISAYLKREDGGEEADASYGDKKAKAVYDSDETGKVFSGHYSAEHD